MRWKVLKDFPNYKISEKGDIFSFKSSKILSLRLDKYGYVKVSLFKEGKHYIRSLHRLLYSTFIEEIDSNIHIDHKNGNKLDNSLDNLRKSNNQLNNYNKKAKGYYWSKDKNRWRSQIYVNKKRIYLGYYVKEKDARNAYVKAVLKYHEGFHDQKITQQEIDSC